MLNNIFVHFLWNNPSNNLVSCVFLNKVYVVHEEDVQIYRLSLKINQLIQNKDFHLLI